MLRVTRSGHILCADPLADDVKTAYVKVYPLNGSEIDEKQVKVFQVPGSVEEALHMCAVKPQKLAAGAETKSQGGADDASDQENDDGAADGADSKHSSASGSMANRRAFDPSTLTVRAADLDEKAQHLLVLTELGLILAYDFATGSLISFAMTHRRPTHLLFAPTQKHFLVADRLGDVYGFKLKSLLKGEISVEQSSFSAKFRSYFSDNLVMSHGALITAMEFFEHEGKSYLLTADIEQKIRVSPFPDLFNIQTFCQGQPAPVAAAGFINAGSPEKEYVVSASSLTPPKSKLEEDNFDAIEAFEAANLPGSIKVHLWNAMTGKQVGSKTVVGVPQLPSLAARVRTTSTVTFPSATAIQALESHGVIAMAPAAILTMENALKEAVLYAAENGKNKAEWANRLRFSASIGCSFEVKPSSVIANPDPEAQATLEEISIIEATQGARPKTRPHTICTLYLPLLRDVLAVRSHYEHPAGGNDESMLEPVGRFGEISSLDAADLDSIVTAMCPLPSKSKFTCAVQLATGTLLVVELADNLKDSRVIARIAGESSSASATEVQSSTVSVLIEGYLRCVANHAKNEDIVARKRESSKSKHVKHGGFDQEDGDDE